MTVVTAKLRYVRFGPKKLRLLADVVRGKKAQRAVTILSLMNKKGARPLRKLIESAIANAKNNHQLEPADMILKTIMVDGGPSLKRFMPKAHGRATPVRERTSHVTVELMSVADLKASKKSKPAAK